MDATVVKKYVSNVVHPTKQNNLVSTNNVDDEDLVDNIDVEWICVNKECLFHHHNEDNDDEENKSISKLIYVFHVFSINYVF